MTDALTRVRRAVQRAFERGELGVFAARFDIAEAKLRKFANGVNEAITVEEAVRIARHVFAEES